VALFELVSGTVGPMTRDFEGLVFATKAILNDHHFQLDPAVPPIKFQEEVGQSYSAKIYWTLNSFK
jgi:hypothetical protein